MPPRRFEAPAAGPAVAASPAGPARNQPSQMRQAPQTVCLPGTSANVSLLQQHFCHPPKGGVSSTSWSPPTHKAATKGSPLRANPPRSWPAAPAGARRPLRRPGAAARGAGPRGARRGRRPPAQMTAVCAPPGSGAGGVPPPGPLLGGGGSECGGNWSWDVLTRQGSGCCGQRWEASGPTESSATTVAGVQISRTLDATE
jgi:hypothetical protein